MKNQGLQIKLLNGFEDTQFSREKWNDLVSAGKSDLIFLTWQWQKAWWDAFGRGQLLLLLAEENDTPVLLAPLFADKGMVYFVGSGGSDYLDFIGDTGKEDILFEMLSIVCSKVENFQGFLFYHVLSESVSHKTLRYSARKLNWNMYEEGSMSAPFMEMKQADAALRKKSLVRHENWFRKSGKMTVKHLYHTNEIIPYLAPFFEQHISRWKDTESPSLFMDPKQCYFYTRYAELASGTNWLVFTVIEFDEIPVAFHFGFHYNNTFMWYKPCFDMSFAKHSPGEVLLKQLILLAQNEKAEVFDFGLGEEDFKKRFQTGLATVHNQGLYPPVKTIPL